MMPCTMLAMSPMVWAFVGLIAVILLIQLLVIQPLLNLYVQARFSGAPVTIFELMGMKLRKADARLIVFSHIRAVRAGLEIPVASIEAHQLAGGDVAKVVNAMIMAHRADVGLDWSDACAIDLGGHDIPEYVERETGVSLRG